MVLSNNDGCIISRSDEAKRLGVEMAGPYFLAKPIIEKHNVDANRIDIIGRGWDEPLGPDPEQNRRVEVQWFMLE